MHGYISWRPTRSLPVWKGKVLVPILCHMGIGSNMSHAHTILLKFSFIYHKLWFWESNIGQRVWFLAGFWQIKLLPVWWAIGGIGKISRTILPIGKQLFHLFCNFCYIWMNRDISSLAKKGYFVTKIVLTYYEKKLF